MTSSRRVHIVGRKNSGKTTLVCDLVTELTRRGLKVATVKHTHHHHELDTPGKDSHRHREAGAAAVGILSPQMTALFIPAIREPNDDGSSGVAVDRERRYSRFEAQFADCDVILVEGDLQTTAPRLEVWRMAVAEHPYAAEDQQISALISDDVPTGVTRDRIPRSDIQAIGDFVLTLCSTKQ
jgi:molybdopterin-guanine dinucleotide biosynthesis adapter protein